METLTKAVQIFSRDLGLAGRGAHLVIPSILGPILAAVLVFNRVYWRIALVHTIGYDDLCILLSLVFLFAHCCVNLVAVDYGYGRPAASLTTYDLHRALQMFYLDQIFYKLTINLTKISILALYLRIFSQRWFCLVCTACAVVVAGYAVASILVTVFQCTPIPRVWNKSIPGTCINITAFWYANAIYNLVTDVVILASVPGVVWSLRLTLRQRLGLTAVFGLGIFVFATSILRMTTLDVSSKSPDPTSGTLKSTVWTTIEASTAIVCACLPMVRTPLQRLFPRIFPTKNGSGTGTGAGSAAGPANISAAGGKGYESLQSPTAAQHEDRDLELGSTALNENTVRNGSAGTMNPKKRTASKRPLSAPAVSPSFKRLSSYRGFSGPSVLALESERAEDIDRMMMMMKE